MSEFYGYYVQNILLQLAQIYELTLHQDLYHLCFGKALMKVYSYYKGFCQHMVKYYLSLWNLLRNFEDMYMFLAFCRWYMLFKIDVLRLLHHKFTRNLHKDKYEMICGI